MADTVQLNTPIPADLHAEVKSTAALAALTLRSALIEALREWVERQRTDQETP